MLVKKESKEGCVKTLAQPYNFLLISNLNSEVFYLHKMGKERVLLTKYITSMSPILILPLTYLHLNFFP